MSTVFHNVFGEGTVKNLTEGYIEVDFSGQVKKFLFPKAFDVFLTTEDAELLQMISGAETKRVQTQKEAIEPITPSIATVQKRPVRQYGTFENRINNPLLGNRAQTIPVHSEEEMFELVGYMAAPHRVSSIEAEVPRDGRDKTFESLFPDQTYRPIEMGDTPSGLPNKLSPQFRINFGDIRNCPDILKKNMGKGNGSCVGRINKSKFVIDIVQNYGFRFGDRQDISAIRSIAEKRGFIDAFERGYRR